MAATRTVGLAPPSGAGGASLDDRARRLGGRVEGARGVGGGAFGVVPARRGEHAQREQDARADGASPSHRPSHARESAMKRAGRSPLVAISPRQAP